MAQVGQIFESKHRIFGLYLLAFVAGDSMKDLAIFVLCLEKVIFGVKVLEVFDAKTFSKFNSYNSLTYSTNYISRTPSLLSSRPCPLGTLGPVRRQ